MIFSPASLKHHDAGLCRLARPAAGAIRLLGAFRPPSSRPLVVRPGGMGDLICCQIALEEMGLDPREIDWLIERRSAAWARLHHLPHHCYDSELASISLEMGGSRKVVINTEQLFGLSQVLGEALASHRGDLYAFSANRAAGRHCEKVAYNWDDEHEVVAFSKLFAAALGQPALQAPPVRERRRAAVSGPVVALAGRQEPARNLGLGSWQEFLRENLQGNAFTLTAASVDQEFARELAASFPGQCSLIAGSFTEICQRIATSERLLTMDGGMVHVASYYGVPTTAIFTSGRHLKWAPLAAGSRIVRHGRLSCQPCTKFGQTPPCPHGHACHSFPRKASAGAVH